MIRTDVFGYFENDTDEVPAHDPGLDATCPFCGNQLIAPRKTISLALKKKENRDRSYFYRTHKACYENLSEGDITDIESSLIDAIV